MRGDGFATTLSLSHMNEAKRRLVLALGARPWRRVSAVSAEAHEFYALVGRCPSLLSSLEAT
jgi:hypothetical protein